MKVTIEHTTRTKPPRIPYQEIKDKIAGKTYELTVVFVGEQRAQSLNEQYRNKSYIPNVLSFPLNDSTGEIYICPAVAKKEAKKFNLSVTGYMAFLLIHGLLHLKGHDHGATMEKRERTYLKTFGIT